ncbi:MAG: hypothetical protein QM775_24950 [Pirellulales bacterium]
MANPRALPIVLAILLAGSSGVAGFAIAHLDRDATPASATGDAVLAELRALTAQIARLEERLAARHEVSAPLAMPREATAVEVPARGEAIDEERLLRIVQAALAAQPRGDDDALRQVRAQNPQPNAVAVADLDARLTAADGQGALEQALQRDWWLLGMADVVRRLGMPGNLAPTKDGQIWEYLLPGERCVNIYFRHGLVERVAN